jgi:hypothetical protein
MYAATHRFSRLSNLLSGASAFVLSAILGMGFVMLVDKTHYLFAGLQGCRQSIEGTWIGILHDVPAVLITVHRSGDELAGTVAFRAVLNDANGVHPTGDPVMLQLEDLSFDGRTLHFKVADQRALPAIQESGVEMTLIGNDQAEMRCPACGTGADEAVRLTRVV